MGCGDKHHHHHHHHLNFHVQVHLPFHIHYHHHHHGHGIKKEQMEIPRGCVTVLVGQGEEQQKFVIPVMHINHPLFSQLLKEAEKEYEFNYHNGPINIPCHVEDFRHVEGMIDNDYATHHLWTCFKA